VEYSQRKSIPTQNFKGWSSKTNILNYLGVHYIDLMRFITQAFPKKVSATGQNYYLEEMGIETYDAIECSIEWQSINTETFIQTIFTNWVDPDTSTSASDQKIKLIGTKGRFESDQKNRGLFLNVDNKSPKSLNPYFCSSFKNPDNNLEWSGYGIDSIVDFLSSASSLISGNTSLEDMPKSKPSFGESIYSTSVLQAAKQSLDSNSCWIEI
jgi:predicted dehydrogenase